MLISSAYAQTAGGGIMDGGMIQFLPLVLIFVVFWFFLIRPQQKKMKDHREMVANLKRGDNIVTGGGIIGKVTKVVDDNTVQVELADEVRVKVVRSTITDVLGKTEPTAARSDNDNASGSGSNTPPSEKRSLFGFGWKK